MAKTIKAPYLRNNQEYVSVTTVTSLIAKPALYRYYATHGWEEASRLSEEAMTHGTRVHNLIDRHFKNEEFEPQEVDNNLSIGNFINFIEFYKPELVVTEQVVYSDNHQYAGTLDGIFKIDGQNILVDWKTSSGIFPDYRFQLEAYYRAYLENPLGKEVVNIDEMWVVRLDKTELVDYTKEWKKDVVKYKPNEKVFKGFLGLLDYYKATKEGKE